MNTLDLFKNAPDVKEFRTGDIIFREGEPGDSMYVVLDGAVDIMVGDEKFIVAGPGEILGEMALIDSSARSATAVARKDCKLVPVNEQRFKELIQLTPAFAVHVMKILVERLRRMNRILASML